MVYNLSMFEVVCKKVTFFETICELTFKNFVSFCVQGQSGLGIMILDHFQTCFNVMNLMEFSELGDKLPL